MKILADNWGVITEKVISEYDALKCYGGFTHSDILSETFEYVIRESKIINASDDEVINYFLFTHKKIMYKVIKNSRLEKQIYANNLQTKKVEPK